MRFVNIATVKLLLFQTSPMLIGLLAIMGTQLVDSAFIGQLGALPLAVMGFSIALYQVVIGVQVGLGISTTAAISQALGANQHTYAKLLASLVLLMGIILITLVCLVLWFWQQPIVLTLGADSSLLYLVDGYFGPWLFSCWLGAILYFGYSLCRAYGDNFLSGRIMVLTSLLNLGLDPLFIFTFDLGLVGAAWATVVAFMIGNIVIYQAVFKRAYLTFKLSFNESIKGVKSLTSFAIPAMLSQFLPPISVIAVTMIVASFGEAVIATWGLANRIEYITIILILALTMSLPPMLGKLMGKRDYAQLYQLVKHALIIVLVVQLDLALLLAVGADFISSLLTTESSVRGYLTSYFYIVPLSLGALGICMICVSSCNAMGLPRSALILSILRLFCCYIPLVWLGASIYGVNGLFIGAMLGNILSGVLGWFIFVQQYKKLINPKQSLMSLADLQPIK